MKKPFIKSAEEIRNIKKACKVTDLAFDYILKRIILWKSEKELARELTIFLKKRSDGIAFRTIVSFGENSSEIHHKPGNRRLQYGDMIMFDFGAKIKGFCSDMTRTVFFGKTSNKQKRLYKTVLTSQKKAIEYLEKSISKRRWVKGARVDKVARKYIESKGYPTIPHSLGHGIGRKVHMGPRIAPKSRTRLKPGMVFTIEPAIYLKGFGGVRIEDVVLLRKTGVEVLTKSPKSITETQKLS